MNSVNTRNYEYIVENYKFLVYKIASRFKCPYLEYNDLVQVGFMGMLKAAGRYDLTKNVKFTTFATYYILGAIKDELRKVTKDYHLKTPKPTIFFDDFDHISYRYLNFDDYDFSQLELKIIKFRLNGLTQDKIGQLLNLDQSNVSRMLKTIKNKIGNPIK